MNERYAGTDRVPTGTWDEALAGTRVRVDHLHFDRRARVWRTHAELGRELTPQALPTVALSAGGGAEAA